MYIKELHELAERCYNTAQFYMSGTSRGFVSVGRARREREIRDQKNKTVSFRITTENYEKLHKIAKKESLSVSQMINEIIDEKIGQIEGEEKRSISNKNKYLDSFDAMTEEQQREILVRERWKYEYSPIETEWHHGGSFFPAPSIRADMPPGTLISNNAEHAAFFELKKGWLEKRQKLLSSGLYSPHPKAAPFPPEVELILREIETSEVTAQ